MDAWRNEGIACGLDLPAITEPDYTASPDELRQMAVTAGEMVDTAWANAASDFSVSASVPNYRCKVLL